MNNSPKPQKPMSGAIARKLARKSKALAKHPAKPVNRAFVPPAYNTRAAARFAPVAGQGLANGASQTRPAPILPTSYDAASHTVEFVIATNQPVKVSGGYVEILSLEPGAADLSRVDAGIVPLIDTHNSGTIEGALGSVIAARIEGGKIIGTFRFSQTEEGIEAEGQVARGELRGCSIGYRIDASTQLASSGGDAIYRVDAWCLLECSLVVTPADPAAVVRSHGTFSQGRAVAPRTSPISARMAVTLIGQAETCGVRADIEALIEAGASEKACRDLILKTAVAAQAVNSTIGGPGRGYEMHQTETRDNPEYMARAIMDAVAGKMTGQRPAGLAGELAGRSMLDIGADWLASQGVGTRGMNRAQIADAMFSTRSAGGPGSYFGARDGGGMYATSDFPNLLSGGTNHVMLARYQIGACAIKTVSALHNLPDFRPRTLVRVSGSGLLAKVGEADELTHASRQDDGQKLAIATYAKILTVSRQAIVNDDLGGLADQANSFADSSNNTEGTLFAALLNANGGSGPNLSDGQPMFTTARGNKAAVGGALTIATLDIARQAIRNTTDFDGKTPLSLTPKYLLVSPANETAAEQLLTSILATQVSNVNPFAGKLELLVDARLTGNAWRLFADPSQAPVMAHGYLEGATGPQIAMRQGWDRLGMEWRVTLDFGCAAAGWRGAYLNPGQ